MEHWRVYYKNYEVLMRIPESVFDLGFVMQVSKYCDRVLEVFNHNDTKCYKIYPGGRSILSTLESGTISSKIRAREAAIENRKAEARR